MNTINDAMILRENLTEKLLRRASRSNIYLMAPAGYGKTVAIKQMLEKSELDSAVISLDEYDNSVAHFCKRFCEALYSLRPRSRAIAELISHEAFGTAPGEYTLRAVNALSARKKAFIVFDDLFFIHNDVVLNLLISIIHALPKNVRVVLISRDEPPACFASADPPLCLSGIKSGNMRFSTEEIMALYEKRGKPISLYQAEEIFDLTDGWPIGINALLLSGGDQKVAHFDYLENFIRTNIWGKWSENVREFMLCTASARELNPALCDILAQTSESEKLLKHLMLNGSFVYQTSDGVYHYHHLFHNFLRRLQSDRGEAYLFPLLEKEGKWHLARKDLFGALDCFIRLECHDGIADCFKLLIDTGHKYFVFDRLMPIATKSIIEQTAKEHPYIYSLLAWAAMNQGRACDLLRYADLYYARQSEVIKGSPSLIINLAMVRLIDFRVPLYKMDELLRDLIDELAASRLKVGSPIGTINQNMPLLHRGTRDFSECATIDAPKSIATLKAMLGGIFAPETELLENCLVAGILYEQGQLETALNYAVEANNQLNENSTPEIRFFTKSILAYVLDALKLDERLNEVLHSIDQFIESEKAYYLNYNFNAYKLRRELISGNVLEAQRWLSANAPDLCANLDFYRLYGHITSARAYIARGDYDFAIILINKAMELVTTYKRPLDIIELEILLSISYWKKKRNFEEEALAHLQNAVLMAYDRGYTQIFINEGSELVGMLRRLHNRAAQPNSIIPASFVKKLFMHSLAQKDCGLTKGLPEPHVKYTQKQLNVMRLLCSGNSFRDIALSMGIKLPTLRSHIALIYKKLNVTSEADAIIKIKSLGLLNDE